MTSFKSKSSSNNANVMSPTQTKVLQECADCGSTNTKWASVNHGVVICDDCCLVHRTLGRSISIIKSISKSYWPQSLIDILYDLVRNGSNQIWESNLQSSEIQQMKQIPRKKPSHKDAISTKTNYIKAKYENLIFLSRGKYTSIEELNQQLISTVKTNNYEMCLRLLAQGADVNYKSQDDGLSCLHTAVVNGQLGQVELLCLYGADLNMVDRSNNSAYDLAIKNNFQHISDRLVELQFELTDELTYFLCNKRPDHKSGQHFFIPEINESENNEMPKHTKSRLLELPDHLFEELCKDVYDEADRRQIETIWKCSVNQNLAKEEIPFLVIKSCFSQTRNQLRQKLARFTTNEFSNLIIEILNEARNRFNRFNNNQKIQTFPRKFKKAKPEELSEEDLLYDKVPSDEDYASVASESTTANDYPQVTSPVLTRKVLQQQQQNNHQYQGNSSQKIISKEHKIVELKTNFDKPFKINNTPTTPTRVQSSTSSNSGNGNLLSPTQSKFANTEQTINAILHSLNNQSENSPFSRLDKRSNESLLDKKNYQDIKNENELMKSMINSLMEENAQLRADKMLLSTAVNDQSTNSPANGEDRFALYSTVNKKSSSLRAINKLPTANSPNKTLNWAEQQQQINSLKLHLKDAHNGKDSEQVLKIEIEKGNEFTPNRSRLDSTESEYENNTSKYFKTLTLSSPTNKKLDVLQVEEGNEPQNNSNDNLNLFDNLKFMPKYVKHEHYNQLSSLSSSPNSACPLISPKLSMQNNKNHSDDTLTVSTTTPTLPTKDAVIKKMKKITKTIQELYKATKDSKSELYKQLCEKVNQSVNEMIDLFSQPYDSKDIQECISLLTENCKNLLDLIDKHYSQLCDNNKPSIGINIAGHMSNSSSSSSAISSLSANAQNDDVIFKNTIVNNMINYCYDIVFNVKKLVCIIGVDN